MSRHWTDNEGPVHRAVLAHLRRCFPGGLHHHSPNSFGMAGPAIARQIAKHKMMGMVVGWPDLVSLIHGRVIGWEVKAEGGSLTSDQKLVGDAFQRLGHLWAVVRSEADVDERLAEWGIVAQPLTDAELLAKVKRT